MDFGGFKNEILNIKFRNLQKLKEFKMNIQVKYNTGASLSYDHMDFSKYGSPENVIELDCGYNKLLYLPDNLNIFKNLEVLNCEENAIAEFPQSIENLINLKEINASINNFKNDTVMDNISYLPNLEVLNCSCNMIDHLEFDPKMKKLKILDISCNDMDFIDESIQYLTNLQELDISNNKISFLTSNIGKLTKLTKLDCSHNRLEYLPESLQNLTLLKEFRCEEKCLQISTNVKKFLSTVKTVKLDDKIQTPPKLTKFTATQICKLALLENKLCPIELAHLADFEKWWVFHCGHLCVLQKQKLYSCPECRNKSGHITIEKSDL